MADFFKGAKEGFQDFGHAITWMVNLVLLLIVYLLGVGLSALIAKMKKQHSLDLSIDKENARTYWKDYNLSTQKKSNYYRQF